MPIRNIVTGQNVGQAKVERARDLRREMTQEERVLWEKVRKNRLGGFHFRRQQVIDGFIVDFYRHEASLVIELDGSIHEGQAEYDQERDLVMTKRGFRVIRFRNEAVLENLKKVLADILEACEERI